MQRHWIEVMQLLAPAPDGGDEIRRFQNDEMLGHCLPCHVEVLAQFAQRPPVALEQFVEQFSATWVSQRFEHRIHDTRTICNHLVACQEIRFCFVVAAKAEGCRWS